MIWRFTLTLHILEIYNLKSGQWLVFFQAALYIINLWPEFSGDRSFMHLLQETLRCSVMIKMRSNHVSICSAPRETCRLIKVKP